MQRLWLILTFLVMMVSPQLGGCAVGKPVYSTHDSGKPGVGISGWLDNDTVVFYSEQRAQAKPGAQGPPPVLEAGYYVWDIAKGTLNKDLSLHDAVKVCVQGNVVTFLRKSPTDGNKWLVVTREHGHETIAPFLKTEWFNRFSCRYYEEKPNWIIQGHETLPLMDGHGFLDWSLEEEVQPRQKRRITFYQSAYTDGIKLPISMRQVWRTEVVYASFKGGYLLAPHSYIDPETWKEEAIGLWPKGKPVPMWWMAPDGTVTTEEVPYMPFMRGGSRAFSPTRKGIFISTHKTDDMWKPGEAGGYLAQGGKVTKLITGMLEQITVSPDGCKVAFLHDPYVPAPVLERVKVKVINVCEEGSHVH